jgi:hypothetical protein
MGSAGAEESNAVTVRTVTAIEQSRFARFFSRRFGMYKIWSAVIILALMWGTYAEAGLRQRIRERRDSRRGGCSSQVQPSNAGGGSCAVR